MYWNNKNHKKVAILKNKFLNIKTIKLRGSSLPSWFKFLWKYNKFRTEIRVYKLAKLKKLNFFNLQKASIGSHH